MKGRMPLAVETPAPVSTVHVAPRSRRTEIDDPNDAWRLQESSRLAKWEGRIGRSEPASLMRKQAVPVSFQGIFHAAISQEDVYGLFLGRQFRHVHGQLKSIQSKGRLEDRSDDPLPAGAFDLREQ